MKKNLVLLHGALGSSKSWNALLPLLSDDFNFYIPDFPGHGAGKGRQPPQTVGNLPAFVSFLNTYIEQNITGEYYLIGYSMGGYIALKFAADNPPQLKGVVTIATKFSWSPKIAAEEAAKLTEENLAPLLAKMQEEHARNFENILTLTQNMLLSIGNDPLTKIDLEKINIPVTLALGDRDKMVSYEETKTFADYIPNGKTALLVNQPHLLQKMDAGVIKNFIRQTLLSF